MDDPRQFLRQFGLPTFGYMSPSMYSINLDYHFDEPVQINRIVITPDGRFVFLEVVTIRTSTALIAIFDLFENRIITTIPLPARIGVRGGMALNNLGTMLYINLPVYPSHNNVTFLGYPTPLALSGTATQELIIHDRNLASAPAFSSDDTRAYMLTMLGNIVESLLEINLTTGQQTNRNIINQGESIIIAPSLYGDIAYITKGPLGRHSLLIVNLTTDEQLLYDNLDIWSSKTALVPDRYLLCYLQRRTITSPIELVFLNTIGKDLRERIHVVRTVPLITDIDVRYILDFIATTSSVYFIYMRENRIIEYPLPLDIATGYIAPRNIEIPGTEGYFTKNITATPNGNTVAVLYQNPSGSSLLGIIRA